MSEEQTRKAWFGWPQVVGARVLQRVAGGVPGVTYMRRCEATHGADVRVLAGAMRVQWAGG